MLCEDGGESPDQYGPGARLIGLTRGGESFYLAKNNVELTSTQIANAGKTVAEGDYRENEFCGACWIRTAARCSSTSRRRASRWRSPGPWLSGSL